MDDTQSSLEALYPLAEAIHDDVGHGWKYHWGSTTFTVYGPCLDGEDGKVFTEIEGQGRVIVNIHDDPFQREMAVHFGYGNDYLTLNKEHDPLHVAVAVAENLLHSPTLSLVIRGEWDKPEHAQTVHTEECKVWALARLINREEWHPELLGPILGADERRTRALATLVADRLRSPWV